MVAADERPATAGISPASAPPVRADAKSADHAFAVHATLARAEAVDQHLTDNPYWRRLREVAFTAFATAFEIAQ